MDLDRVKGRMEMKTHKPMADAKIGCTVHVLGSQYWATKVVLPYELPHTMNHIAAQLFSSIGLMPSRCEFPYFPYTLAIHIITQDFKVNIQYY
jgi:hypothetical protein